MQGRKISTRARHVCIKRKSCFPGGKKKRKKETCHFSLQWFFLSQPLSLPKMLHQFNYWTKYTFCPKTQLSKKLSEKTSPSKLLSYFLVGILIKGYRFFPFPIIISFLSLFVLKQRQGLFQKKDSASQGYIQKIYLRDTTTAEVNDLF